MTIMLLILTILMKETWYKKKIGFIKKKLLDY